MAPVKILLNDFYFSNLLSGYVELDKQQFFSEPACWQNAVDY